MPASYTQFKLFLQCLEDNFLMQMIEELTRRGVLLDLILTNKKGLVGEVKASFFCHISCTWDILL